MKNATLLAIVASAGLAASALAQPVGTATYAFHFGAPGGPSQIVPNPGQTFSVFVSVSFSPGIGSIITSGPTTGPVLGLSDGGFNIAASGGGGSWSNLTLDAPYNFPLGTSAGTPSGMNVSGVLWGLGFLLQPPHPSPFNPDIVWSGTMTWNGAGITTLSFTNLAQTGVFFGGPIPAVALYDSVGTQGLIGFPAPGAAALLAFAGLIAARRRRPT